MTDGGEGRSGFTNNEKVRKAHSERMKSSSFNPSKRPEVRAKLAGQNNPMFGLRGKLSPHYGKTRADQSIKLECPYCGKEGGAAGIRRWHFENCPEKVLQ
jgi:ribosomal protein L44E